LLRSYERGFEDDLELALLKVRTAGSLAEARRELEGLLRLVKERKLDILDSRRDDPCRRCRYRDEWAGCTALECWREAREPKQEVGSK